MTIMDKEIMDKDIMDKDIMDMTIMDKDIMDMNIMDMNMTMVKQVKGVKRILWQGGAPLPTTLVLSNAFTTDT